MIRKFSVVFLIPMLAACASTGGVAPGLPATYNNPGLQNVQGLDIVMGKSASNLIRLFGDPAQDVEEAPGRKLQFSSGACILDAYLYPPQGGGDARVTHIDTRRSDGAEVDRVSCVNALRVR